MDLERVVSGFPDIKCQHGIGGEAERLRGGQRDSLGILDRHDGFKPAGDGIGQIGDEIAGLRDKDQALPPDGMKNITVGLARQNLPVEDDGKLDDGRGGGRRFRGTGLAEFRKVADQDRERIGGAVFPKKPQRARSLGGIGGDFEVERDSLGELAVGLAFRVIALGLRDAEKPDLFLRGAGFLQHPHNIGRFLLAFLAGLHGIHHLFPARVDRSAELIESLSVHRFDDAGDRDDDPGSRDHPRGDPVQVLAADRDIEGGSSFSSGRVGVGKVWVSGLLCAADAGEKEKNEYCGGAPHMISFRRPPDLMLPAILGVRRTVSSSLRGNEASGSIPSSSYMLAVKSHG